MLLLVPKKLLEIITPSKLDRFTKEVADSRDMTQTMTSQSVIDNNQAGGGPSVDLVICYVDLTLLVC